MLVAIVVISFAIRLLQTYLVSVLSLSNYFPGRFTDNLTYFNNKLNELSPKSLSLVLEIVEQVFLLFLFLRVVSRKS
jgi:hypothetical protein